MSAILSPADLEALRSDHPHVVRLHMSVYVPDILYCGVVDGAHDRGARDVTVADESGDITDIEEGMTILVGTSCGDYSKSRRRFRSRAGQVLTLDENPVDWDAGDYITAVRNWELWSIFPYIDADDDYTFYKDRDVAYTDQNEEPPPVAIAGPNRAAFLDGYSVTFNIRGDDSYAIADGATISTYLWACDTASGITNPNIANTTISFVNPGQHWVTLTVTDSNGKSQTTRRIFFIHQRSGAYAPYDDFIFEGSPSGDWDTGGWTCNVRLRDNAELSSFPDRAMVLIWCESFYGGVEKYLYDSDYGNIIISGYIKEESIEKDLDTGSVLFDVYTINDILDNTKMMSISLEYDSTPETWYQFADLTTARAAHHLWKWHSTLFDICDVYLPMDNEELLDAVDDFEEGSLYSMVDAFTYQHSIFAHVCSNKWGQLYVEVDVNMHDVADRAAIDYWLILEEQDKRGPVDLEIVRDSYNRVGYAMASGMNFDGTDSTPVISQAPADIPHNTGKSDVIFERLVLENQADGNMTVGRIIAIANTDIIEYRVPLTGNYLQCVDIVPQYWVLDSLTGVDNKRGITFTNKRFVIKNINTEIQVEAGTCLVDTVMFPECFGPDGIPGNYPTGNPWPDFEWPWPELPELPGWEVENPTADITRNCHRPGNVSHTVNYDIDAVPDTTENAGNSKLITDVGTSAKQLVSSENYVYWIDSSGANLLMKRFNIATEVEDDIEVTPLNVGGYITLLAEDLVAVLYDGGYDFYVVIVNFQTDTVTPLFNYTQFPIQDDDALEYTSLYVNGIYNFVVDGTIKIATVQTMYHTLYYPPPIDDFYDGYYWFRYLLYDAATGDVDIIDTEIWDEDELGVVARPDYMISSIYEYGYSSIVDNKLVQAWTVDADWEQLYPYTGDDKPFHFVAVSVLDVKAGTAYVKNIYEVNRFAGSVPSCWHSAPYHSLNRAYIHVFDREYYGWPDNDGWSYRLDVNSGALIGYRTGQSDPTNWPWMIGTRQRAYYFFDEYPAVNQETFYDVIHNANKMTVSNGAHNSTTDGICNIMEQWGNYELVWYGENVVAGKLNLRAYPIGSASYVRTILTDLPDATVWPYRVGMHIQGKKFIIMLDHGPDSKHQWWVVV